MAAAEWLSHMQICILTQTHNHASIPPLNFSQAGCPSCHPTNSVKALQATSKNKFTTLDVLPPTSVNQYTVLNYYQHLYHRHYMSILQPSAIASDILHISYLWFYSHASILHVILPLIKPFSSIIFSFSCHN